MLRRVLPIPAVCVLLMPAGAAPPKGAVDPAADDKIEKVVAEFLKGVKAGKPDQLVPLAYLLMPNAVPAAAAEALAKPESVELLSLDPKLLTEKPKDDFHGWKVLGRTTVKDDATRKKLAADLATAAESSEGLAAACFNPRHGLRVTRNGKTVDFVICFECWQVKVYEGDKADGFLITDTPQPAFDKVLRDAGVTLPAKPEK